MRGQLVGARLQAVALLGVVERNIYIVKRYGFWELAFFVWVITNTLTVVFIAKGIEAGGGKLDVERQTASLLIGAVIFAYLGVVFEMMTETVAWERWEGTIEYTFMAPLSRTVHLWGMGVFAVLYGVVRTALLFVVVAQFFGLSFPHADFGAALVLVGVASVSIIGIGTGLAVLPLISPEKGAQLALIAQGLLLVISGVYYPVAVLPEWMQWLGSASPATYALDGIRAALLDGAPLSGLWHDVWPMVVIAAVSVPVGLLVFRAGEGYAKRTGKLKRGG